MKLIYNDGIKHDYMACANAKFSDKNREIKPFLRVTTSSKLHFSIRILSRGLTRKKANVYPGRLSR